ncbi:polysaccharide deacetylase family protein [Fulvivirga sediminis]|uniref:Polysaccharide deacetylase family protein n=1 Tax=Fulvivirga sediminis TaxID=2803949 RepID=A0A937F9Z9_9BACT|nr:polysaccharide deacetylase family protein [Fulvivirga sediminis]MBL3659031.1 polysaccharide deacetylase family protein [Fulvivirga sediminis]
MMRKIYILLLYVMISSAAIGQNKTVAITLDDLIVAGSSEYTIDEIEKINDQLLSHLDKFNIPVTGFVNEKSLYVPGEIDRRTEILNAWASRKALDLGNHTFSHPSFHDTKLEDFKAEVLKGELITRMILDHTGKQLQYFRFPFNSAGSDSSSKASFEQFLAEKGYTIAPFTVESSDYIFNALYKRAKGEGNVEKMEKIKQQYLDHTDTLFTFFEKMALEVHGKHIPHIFLGHVNELHADVMPQLVALLQDRGYTIVSLSEVMKDDIYQQKDPYVGKWGFSWLHRWNTKNRIDWLRKEPEPNQQVLSEYKALN